MIKGKFAATIEIDIAIDENTPNLLPFEKLKEAVQNDMDIAVKDMLGEEFWGIATVKVTKTFADLYRTEDKHEDDWLILRKRSTRIHSCWRRSKYGGTCD